jgi:hypothetical protein
MLFLRAKVIPVNLQIKWKQKISELHRYKYMKYKLKQKFVTYNPRKCDDNDDKHILLSYKCTIRLETSYINLVYPLYTIMLYT